MPKAKFDLIYQQLRADIIEGLLPPGSAFPTEMALVERFGCSRSTVRRAISMLASDGYVQSLQGKGVTVIYQPSGWRYVAEGLETFTEMASRLGKSSQTYCPLMEVISLDDSLAQGSGMAFGTDVWHVEIVRSLDGKALIHSEGFLRASVVPRLSRDVFEKGSLYDYLENGLGVQVVTSKHLISSEEASPRDLELLDLDGLDFVSSVTTWSYDADGKVFEYLVSHHHPNYFAFSSVSKRRR